MSFFSSPSKYLREALEARRARQRAELREAHQIQHRQPFFGERRNLHDHRHGPRRDRQSEEPRTDQSIQFVSNWKSIGDFLPSIFSPKELESEDSEVTISEDVVDNSEIPPPQIKTLSPGPGSSVVVNVDSSIADLRDVGSSSTSVGDRIHENEQVENAEMKSQLGSPDPDDVLMGGDDYSRGRRDIPNEIELLPFGQPESIPSDPIFFSDQSDCWGPLRCHRYTVSHKLTNNCMRQSRFLKRVMLLMSAHYAFLIFWMAVVISLPSLSKPIVDNFNYSYVPLGLFILSKLLLRSMLKIRKLKRWVLLVIAFTRVICIAYYCGAVSVFADTEIILLTAIVVFLSQAFFTVTPHFVDYDVGNSEIIGMATVVNIMFAILIAFPFIICKSETSTMLNIIVLNWLPSFFASLIIIMFMVFDMKQIMTGWRFPLGEADWIFTVLYV